VTINFVISVCLSVHMEQLSSHLMDFHKFDIRIFNNCLRKCTFDWNLTRIKNTLYEDLWKFKIISCWILLRMKNVSNKSCREN
jgi:hypothetical protein